MKVQRIDDAAGPLNLDLYQVEIQKNPTTGGVELDPVALLAHFRKHINDFIDKDLSVFEPLEVTDTTIWLSPDPMGAVVKIDLKGPDNAAVWVAEADTRHWRFVTVWTDATGAHPVSGVREFGVWGNMIYVRGADRTTGPPESWLSETAFGMGHSLWLSFQQGLKKFVEEPLHGGRAKIIQPEVVRMDWDPKVKTGGIITL